MKKIDHTQRKNEHLDIIFHSPQTETQVKTGFAEWRFQHCALPELDLDRIDLKCSLFGKILQAPLLISSMTGGVHRAHAINHHLAEAAQILGISMGVGSQRVALENEANDGLSRSLRQIAPDILLFANLGAAQIRGEHGFNYALRAVQMIEADALIIHLNPLQEALQQGGDRNWRHILYAIEQLVTKLGVPIIVKEVGSGLSLPVAHQLAEAGVSMLDIAGAGGTSWAAIEAERASTPYHRALAMAFADWGIPTTTALREIREALPNMPLIASGGIRNGVDAAKAYCMGAQLVGQAAAVIHSAALSTDAVIEHFQLIIEQIKVACFCTGSTDIAALRTAVLLPT
ncbi:MULTISPECIES: type 2 isopentenyl-diphosphate Delta-isomerase [Photorhabdus]|uniref:type 2 isopentenyl-diphosphate Delta-isomerase n=1 Tax=Photorhabdus TaxID=29487 RepID=UPI000DCF4351|nr:MULTISPECIES: type 2 isopentenyl-diphosphate Delta-isomerase [Photorhabdus]MCT8343167.1 type 2 isopentenyl-diphosphate Delta-isomerase [Photorhabdus kleinii]RAW99250.1 type 2 isopentenyl-diphosphate Delta-isomerase [Photorhabdus sp. S10-54]RAW99332.1 type 2 isopentenyl-diphosphate Delta-isomerase [Photorhabdus sp. S9-53]RAX03537.1 type 2 isopentenyl-diphosphate Delta-isomerase [Photorhabdus sp. S8-52]